MILANPPFMSPKGGIRPHNRFSVKSKRSEVLFVDYMAEHLTPAGRAGIIVPEGIIFQSQKAHTALRKMLVEEYLVAVVSLPGGVFNPYSGVKTSILILDKNLARRARHIAFFKVEADGYDLGAQRRAADRNDLPQVQADLGAYLNRLQSGESPEDFALVTGLIVEKDKVAAGGDYNLSGDRYRATRDYGHTFPLVNIGDTTLFRVESGGTPKSTVADYWNGSVAWATLVDLPPDDLITEIQTTQRTISAAGLKKSSATLLPEHSVVVSTRATIGRIGINRIPLATNQGFKNIVIEDHGKVLPEYVALAITKLVPTMESWASGGTFKEISKSLFCKLQIPLPPLEVQQEIAAEIEGYQRVIDGARAVVENYRPHIAVDHEWPLVELGNICQFINGRAFKPRDWKTAESGGVPIVRIQNLNNPGSEANYFTGKVSNRHIIDQGQLLFSWSGSRGTSFGAHIWNGGRAVLNQHIFKVEFDEAHSDKFYLFYALNMAVKEVEKNLHGGVGLVHITKGNLERIRIPLPPIATQQAIVTELVAEQTLVDANGQLIERMEQKIQAAIGRVWGSEPTESAVLSGVGAMDDALV